MKFIHIADMHFDSPFTLLSSQENFGDQRRLEQRRALKKIIEKIRTKITFCCQKDVFSERV